MCFLEFTWVGKFLPHKRKLIGGFGEGEKQRETTG
jgi:hypothetical protein